MNEIIILALVICGYLISRASRLRVFENTVLRRILDIRERR
jgi:hypothetical protein